jgi:hypothetical protein
MLAEELEAHTMALVELGLSVAVMAVVVEVGKLLEPQTQAAVVEVWVMRRLERLKLAATEL